MEKLPTNQFQIIEGLLNVDLISVAFEKKIIKITCEFPGMEKGSNFKITPNLEVIFTKVENIEDSEDCYVGEIQFLDFNNESRKFYADTLIGAGHVREI